MKKHFPPTKKLFQCFIG